MESAAPRDDGCAGVSAAPAPGVGPHDAPTTGMDSLAAAAQTHRPSHGTLILHDMYIHAADAGYTLKLPRSRVSADDAPTATANSPRCTAQPCSQRIGGTQATSVLTPGQRAYVRRRIPDRDRPRRQLKPYRALLPRQQPELLEPSELPWRLVGRGRVAEVELGDLGARHAAGVGNVHQHLATAQNVNEEAIMVWISRISKPRTTC